MDTWSLGRAQTADMLIPNSKPWIKDDTIDVMKIDVSLSQEVWKKQTIAQEVWRNNLRERKSSENRFCTAGVTLFWVSEALTHSTCPTCLTLWHLTHVHTYIVLQC